MTTGERDYADDMGFHYCEACGATVIPDGSDDPPYGHVCPVGGAADGSPRGPEAP